MSPAKNVDIVMKGLTWPPESGAAAHINSGRVKRLTREPRMEAISTLVVPFLFGKVS